MEVAAGLVPGLTAFLHVPGKLPGLKGGEQADGGVVHHGEAPLRHLPGDAAGQKGLAQTSTTRQQKVF